jgi:hypothetical protein
MSYSHKMKVFFFLQLVGPNLLVPNYDVFLLQMKLAA